MPDSSCQVIDKLEREWRDALCRKDMDKLRSLVHPDFVLIGTRSTGPFMLKREEWLDAIQKRDVETIELDVRDATALDQSDGRDRQSQMAAQISGPCHRGLRAADRCMGQG